MATKYITQIQWIRKAFGGRSNNPVVGLRPIIRFQRHIEQWIMCAIDAEVIEVIVDPITWTGCATLSIPDHEHNISIIGESFELLDSYRVIAVGVVSAKDLQT